MRLKPKQTAFNRVINNIVATQDNKQSTLTIRILGRDYPISCPPDEREKLLSSAEYLSRRMQAIQKKGKTLGIDRIAVMAALNTARELLALQKDVDQLRGQIEGSDSFTPSSRTHEDVGDRLAQLQLRIDTVLDDPG